MTNLCLRKSISWEHKQNIRICMTLSDIELFQNCAKLSLYACWKLQALGQNGDLIDAHLIILLRLRKNNSQNISICMTLSDKHLPQKIAKLSAIASCVLSVLSPTWELVYSNLFTFTQLREKHCSKPKHLHDLVWQRLVQKECAAVIVCLLPGICAVSYSNPNMNTKLTFKKLR